MSKDQMAYYAKFINLTISYMDEATTNVQYLMDVIYEYYRPQYLCSFETFRACARKAALDLDDMIREAM